MFLYDDLQPIEVQLDRPDPQTYFLLDQKLQGTTLGLHQAMVYMRQAFMIHNKTFYEIFMRLSAKEMTHMELLAKLLHLQHGEDDRYLDESNDDTPVFEYIMPTQDDMKTTTTFDEPKHVNNDLTAAVMSDLTFEEGRKILYDALAKDLEDRGAKTLFEYLSDSTQKSIDVLKNTLEILTTHVERKEFGEGDTHETWDLDTSNYFDKPNPYFFTPHQMKGK